MKSPFITIAANFICFWFSSLKAQATVTNWDVELPMLIIDNTLSLQPPKPEPIDLMLLGSYDNRKDVTNAPDMSGYVHMTSTFSSAVHFVEDPEHANFSSLFPKHSPNEPAVVTRLSEFFKNYEGTQLILLYSEGHNCIRTLPTKCSEEPYFCNRATLATWDLQEFEEEGEL